MNNKELIEWKENAEEDYIKTPISILRYITELEKALQDAEDLIETAKDTNAKLGVLADNRYEEINRLKAELHDEQVQSKFHIEMIGNLEAKLSEQLDPIELINDCKSWIIHTGITSKSSDMLLERIEQFKKKS